MSGRGAAPSPSHWRSRCGGSRRSTRSSSWPSTSRPTRWTWHGRTRSATPSRTGSRSRRPTWCLTGASGFDLVVANLPYVRHDAMAGLPVAASFEPAIALDGGEDGLEVIGRLLGRLPAALACRWRGPARDRSRPGRGDRRRSSPRHCPAGDARSSPTWPGCRGSPGSPARPRSACPKRPASRRASSGRARHQDTRTRSCPSA